MFNEALLEQYKAMSAEDKIKILEQMVFLEEQPIKILFAMLLVLKPESGKEIAIHLERARNLIL